ncbi:MAG TPA: OmpA family protein [Chitinophagaceae bacterium]|nr:OmpA family protein [Chitinophagaceae bacterium]
MKKVFLLVPFLSLMLFVKGQILKKITDKAKQKIENKTAKPAEETTNEKKDENKVIEAKDTATTPVTNNNQSASLKVYSKYDFVPGERILVFEDFIQDAVGDFPAKWNTNATGEIMTIDKIPGHWFAMGKTGVYMPDFIDALPDDFTLEFDMLIDQTAHSWGIDINLVELANRDQPKDWPSANNHFSLNILPGNPGTGSSSYHRRKNGVGETTTRAKITQFENMSIPVHISFWRQKERLRVYMNEEKVWDVPKAIQAGAKLNSLVLSIPNIAQWHFLITNLRLAVGAPDTRKKILEQNKWVTHGILFDVNSANIKPESYGTLKEMANVLKEYADLKVKIVGHTDADGKDDANLDLSKRRAASVKAALAKEFGIDESRMETDGKGESEPIDKNDTPAGKANNRRVEFIKI